MTTQAAPVALPDIAARDLPPAAPRAPGAERAIALAPGTKLRDYELRGEFESAARARGVAPPPPAISIVYAGFDHALQRPVAVKEYLPAAIASRRNGASDVRVADEQLDRFRAGLGGFVDEAKQLARFDHPSLAKVYRFWQENGTAYMAMPFYDGPTLQTALAELGRVPSEGELRTWLRPVLDAVSVLHDGGVWHENISPQRILLTPTGPVLLGMAQAGRAIAAQAHTPAAPLAAGYAAIEQYGDAASATRGPWTDLYALAAVVYAAITGDAPQPAADRLRDDQVQPLATVAAGLYSNEFLAAIDAAMAVQPERRPQDHVAFRALMGDIAAPERLELAPRRDLMQEPFLAIPAEHDRIVTVPDRPLLASGPAAAAAAHAEAASADSAPVATSTATPAASTTVATSPAAGTGPAVNDGARRSRPAPDSTPRGERSAASWTAASRAPGRGLGKRALYGFFAVTFVLIGVGALGLQFYARQAPRPAAATAGTTSAATSPPGGAAPVPASPAAPQTSAAPPAAIVAPPNMPSSVNTSAEPTAAQTQTHCLEILQKASLEPITAAETAFFKKECK